MERGRRMASPPPGLGPGGRFPALRRILFARTAAVSAKAAGGSVPIGATIPVTLFRTGTPGSAVPPPGKPTRPWAPKSPTISPPGSPTPSSSTLEPMIPEPWRIRPVPGRTGSLSSSGTTPRGWPCWRRPRLPFLGTSGGAIPARSWSGPTACWERRSGLHWSGL